MLLGAAGREHDDVLRLAEEAREVAHLARRDSRDPLGPLRPPRHRRTPHRLEPDGPLVDVLLGHVAAGDHRVQDALRQSQVRAGHRLDVHVGPVGGGGAPRVDHDDPAAPLSQPVEVPRGRRHRLGEVGADEDEYVGLLDVRERERQPPVDPERPDARGGGGRHAPPAVVVDHARPEARPGELAERVRLLVGEPTAPEHRHRVPAVLGLDGGEPVSHETECVVPARGPEGPCRRVPHQRGGQPLAVPEQRRAGPPLAAHRALVGGELVPGLHLRLAAATGEPHAALERAVGAVGARVRQDRHAPTPARGRGSASVRRGPGCAGSTTR